VSFKLACGSKGQQRLHKAQPSRQIRRRSGQALARHRKHPRRPVEP
jgi:hypothetical protein